MAGFGVAGVALLAAATMCLSTGCSTPIGYLAQSAGGHLDLMSRARPVPQWLADENTPPVLRERLALTQRMRDWAVAELKLPDNGSYRSYADLQRNAAVWNVVAAPELSLRLKTWCFPVVGCVGYRGYFDLPRAQAEAKALQAQGLEVSVCGVPAYSTLGWINWLGGDPLLNTFIHWSEGELARLVFHELAHQVVYAEGDTVFNESFATAVERIGVQRWLAQRASDDARKQYAALESRREDFRGLTSRYRERLNAVYNGDASDADKRAAKARLMGELRTEYARIKAERWGGFAGYDAWFERANNASFAVLAAYNEWVPNFERLFEREDRDFARFYAAVTRLAALPKDRRHATLRGL
jgi:predicted aminopeptidase